MAGGNGSRLNELEGSAFISLTKSVWFQKGLGAGHEHAQFERLHPAPFSYQDVQKLIEFFTKSDGRVLDPFAGVGSTLKAAALAGRFGLGIELYAKWANLAAERLLAEVGPDAMASQQIICGDAAAVLPSLDAESFDLLITSPPYWGILNKKPDHKVRTERLEFGLDQVYGDDPADLANAGTYEDFLAALCSILAQAKRGLRAGAHVCIIVGDFRHGRRYVPFHSDLARALEADNANGTLVLQGMTVLVQNQKRLYPYGYPSAFVPNIHHQFIVILRKI